MDTTLFMGMQGSKFRVIDFDRSERFPLSNAREMGSSR